ncbi:translesion DNA synthesis-associated protein ImuA [Shewanella sp. C32]|uniref:Translesion DNA synthesis-associated protein ImuA n=1 Tax=Shewanella electrica TaxID=515560 RepID=A0ABT2FL36_9GAMM|nr:translesion DNA synthesis-associated protein ImuA [Shewanella electrica]MCH1923810.1 translesion DNA synthesis-associated protein ImuA [Shewanella electrica]MCS4557028.1 translesion DNA synthesis-associated protein ImuA [Shewanella electrica]
MHLPSQPALTSLLNRQDLWLGEQAATQLHGMSTGFAELTQHLPYWPAHGVCELYSQGLGCGELGLLQPLMHAVCSASEPAPIMLIAPPALPNAFGLALLQLPPERFIWLNISSAREALWAMEQVLHSGSCGLVIGWFEQLSLKAARRLQLAAEEGNSLGFCVLPLTQAGNQHPLPLKLALQADSSAVRLSILKRRGGWPVNDIALPHVAVPMWRKMALAAAAEPARFTSPREPIARQQTAVGSLSFLPAANDHAAAEAQDG